MRTRAWCKIRYEHVLPFIFLPQEKAARKEIRKAKAAEKAAREAEIERANMMKNAAKNRQGAAALRHREKMRGATKEGKAQAAAAKKQAKQDKIDRQAAIFQEKEAEVRSRVAWTQSYSTSGSTTWTYATRATQPLRPHLDVKYRYRPLTYSGPRELDGPE